MLIVFEGVDGSGKSTYIKKLVQGLEDAGKRVTATRLPGGTKFGEKIRDVLFGKDVNTKTFHKSTRSLLYAADFAIEIMFSIFALSSKNLFVITSP